MLKDQIKARINAGVSPLFEHLADKVVDGPNGPMIVGKTVAGEPFEITADFVIGADGSMSIAREYVTGDRFSGMAREYPFGWYGILAPAGTPREVVAKLNAELVKAMAAQDMREYFAREKETCGNTAVESVLGGAPDRVPERVPEVQQHPRAALALVLRHRRRPPHRLAPRSWP